MIFLITCLNFAACSLIPTTDMECDVPDLYDQCLTFCRVDYVDCMSHCESSYCHSECLETFQSCDSFCPCGLNCPGGCDDCEHQLCHDCDFAQENNDHYRVCLQIALDQFNVCSKQCPPSFECYDSCYAEYREEMASCPCLEPETTTTTTTTTKTTTTTTTTTTLAPIAPEDTALMIFVESGLSNAYILSGDGSSSLKPTINAPSENFVRYASYAIVNDHLHIFGGSYDSQKIARLEGCSFVQLPALLSFSASRGGEAALAINGGSEALICFPEITSSGNNCDRFDGYTCSPTTSSRYSHPTGGLGMYEGNPTTVGSWFYDGTSKVETLTSDGWKSLADHPEDVKLHNLVGLDSGSLLLIGGYSNKKDVWRLEKGHWSIDGYMEKGLSTGGSILIGSSIYVISGQSYDGYPLQRIDLEDDQIKNTTVIGSHNRAEYWPILYHVSFDFCMNNV